jgi:hypothetical protein
MKPQWSSYFPENYAIRNEYQDVIFGPTQAALRARDRVLVDELKKEERVFFQIKERENYFYILFTNEKDYEFPLFSQGSYIIKRSKKDGRFIQVKIFIRSTPGSFVRIFPNGDRSKMNVFLYGHQVYKNVNIPFAFEDILLFPFTNIMEVTASSIDWELIFPRAFVCEEQNVRDMAMSIRTKLSSLSDQDDGAMDKTGKFVYIDDLSSQEKGGFNCSGFAKWVADGVSYAHSREYLSIEALKQKHPEVRGNRWSERYEKKRDPYFGLDWTRNIATSLGNRKHPEACDVRNVPFCAYIEDVGYAVDKLKLVLYLLTWERPGRFYFGSINSEFGQNPVLRQHHHVVVLLPYFTDSGDFKVAVFERNRETSLESLYNRYPEHYIHLVGAEATAGFEPPPVGAKS